MARIVRLEDKAPFIIDPKEHDRPLAVCRCGLSAGWPMCDGSHKKTTDEDDRTTYAYRRTVAGADLERRDVEAMPEADPRPQGEQMSREDLMEAAEREADPRTAGR